MPYQTSTYLDELDLDTAQRPVLERPKLAWPSCDYADMLKELDGVGDRKKAVRLLDESRTISRELDMKPLMERVLSRREILGAQPPPASGTEAKRTFQACP